LQLTPKSRSRNVEFMSFFRFPLKFLNKKQEYIQSVPELADQIETVYSLMVMKVKNVEKNTQGATAF
jgi:hypothetical protein